MTKQKAPKAQADSLVWIKQQLTDFGIGGIPLRDLIGFVKGALQSPNASVRSSATQVLVTVRIFVGAGMFLPLNPSSIFLIGARHFRLSRGPESPAPIDYQLRVRKSCRSDSTGNDSNQCRPSADG